MKRMRGIQPMHGTHGIQRMQRMQRNQGIQGRWFLHWQTGSLADWLSKTRTYFEGTRRVSALAHFRELQCEGGRAKERSSTLISTFQLGYKGRKGIKGYRDVGSLTGRPAAWPTGCQRHERNFEGTRRVSALAHFRELQCEGGRAKERSPL